MGIVFSSATQLAADIREGQVSARDALEAHLAQIEAHNPAVNAVVTLDAERAYERAREADAASAHGENWGPLHGVPFTLKDAHATAGVRTTTGFPPFADQVPKADGTVAARLKAAGGILMGKPNVHQMLGDPAQTINPIFGRTTNPWDVDRVPGGSSGGAAAAVAAGMTPFDLGTDLSGSIRIPAHFCGVYGLKPTEHRVPLTGLIPGLSTPKSVRIMSCIGPMARTVEDLALLYSIVAGPDGIDTDVPPVPVDDVPAIELTGLRIAVAPTFPGFPASTEMRGAVEEIARQLRSPGAVVDEVLPPLDFGQELERAAALILMTTGAFQPSEEGQPTTLDEYLAALDRRDLSMMVWERFFSEWDALICPPSMLAAFPHCEPGSPLPVDGQDVFYWMVSAHATVFNYSGHPAVALPYTVNRDGLPIGVQIVGKRWSDSRLLGIAQAVSEVAGPFRRPPGF